MRVLIIGAGIVGAATARTLARHGAEVTVLERARIGGGASSSGEGNLLVSDKGRGHELELAQYASRLWPVVAAELADELGPRFPSVEFERKGGVVVATTDEGAESLLAFAAEQRQAGVAAWPLGVREALQLEPRLTPALMAAVHYPEDAQIQPIIATQALVASARLAGARFVENVAAISGIRNADGAIGGVVADGEIYRADAVVVAAGPWSAQVAESLGTSVPVAPRRGMVLVTSRMPPAIAHKVYDADYVGAVGSGSASLQTSTVVESTPAGTVLIGSSRQQIGFDSRLQLDVLRELAAKAILLFPFLEGMLVIRCYGGFRPYAPDHLPILGEDSRIPGVWFATGHEGAGIGLSVATAELLSELMFGGRPEVDAAAFSPGRASLDLAWEGIAG